MLRQIESNRAWSVVLIVGNTLLLAAVGAALDYGFHIPHHIALLSALALALITLVVTLLAGDSLVLSAAAARPVTHEAYPQLDNVVEEVCIAAGMPRPRIYVINSTALNAFATGRTPKRGVIAVTEGLLRALKRDELQGVIAHEMSHIRNSDTLFMMVMAVMVGTIALISDAVTRIVFNSHPGDVDLDIGGDSDSDGAPIGAIILLIVIILFVILAPIPAKLIEMAASRKREYLADASAALLTRYPAGLAAALRRIHDDPVAFSRANRATQHMFIVNPLKGEGGESAWDTHPPITERIARLERMAYLTPEEKQAAAQEAWQRSQAALGLAPAGELAAGVPVPVLPPVAAPPMPAMAAVAAATSAVPPSHETNACPRCQEQLRRGRIDGQALRGCSACGGLWISDASLQALLQSAPEKLAQADHRYPNRIGTGWSSFAEKRCPQCDSPLRARALPERRQLVVDRCEQGHGVWFDDGEMAALVALPATP